MKWTNKGTELKQYQKVFEGKRILIYGGGLRGEELYRFLRPFQCVDGVIDKITDTPIAQNNGDLKNFRYNGLDETIKEKYIIVLAASEPNMNLFARQLMRLGYMEGINFFFYKDFLERYIGIFALYSCGKVYAPFISFQVSTVCNLRCKGCVAFTPQNSKPRHYMFEELKAYLTGIFNNMDIIGTLDVCGGEPFGVPDFGRIITYIREKYGDRIITLRTVTNGTTIPSDELCSILEKYEVKVVLDDYRENVEECRETFQKIKEKLEEWHINFEIRKASYWIDLGVEIQREKKTEEELIRYYDECCNPIRSVHNGKLFSCDYADFARESGVYKEKESDFLDIMQKIDKSVVLEFLMGYTESGYCGMCERCNGCITINEIHIPVAGQMEKSNAK